MKSTLLRLTTAFVILLMMVSPVSATPGSAQGTTAYQSAPLVDWYDNFDSYPTNVSLHGLGGWKGWSNLPSATAYTRDTFSISAPNSVEIMGPSDLVHEYSIDDGTWTYTAWQYMPSSFTGQTYFILLNQYDDAGATNNWSTEVVFDSATDELSNDGPVPGTLPIIYDQWVEIKVEINLTADTQKFYYGGDQLFQGSWSEGMSGGGITSIAAVDLFANNATAVYYDDLSLVETLPYKVALAPVSEPVIGHPTETVTHTFTLTNQGTEADVYALEVDGFTWPTTLAFTQTAEVLPNETIMVEVYVDIPAGVFGTDTFLLEAQSLNEPTANDTAEGTTISEPTPAVNVGEDQTGAGEHGELAYYTFTVTNMGDITDTYMLDVSGNVWTTTLSITETMALGPGESQDFVVTVEVPMDAVLFSSDVVTVTATSELDPMVSDSATATTTAVPTPGVGLGENQTGEGYAGTWVTYVFTVTNLGNYTDTFTLEITGNLWTTTLAFTTTDALAPGASQNVDVNVLVPWDVPAWTTDVVTLIATSMLDPDNDEYDTATATTYALPTAAVNVGPDQTKDGNRGQPVTFFFSVTNEGNITDTFTLDVSGNVWTTTLSVTTTEALAPGETQNVEVTVLVPAGAAFGDMDMFTFTAKSLLDAMVSDSATGTTTVVPALGVDVGADQAGLGQAGQTVTYMFTVINTGEITDTFMLDLMGGAFTSTLSMTNTGELAPGASIDVIVTVEIPISVTIGMTDTVTLVATSTENPAVSDSATATTTVIGEILYKAYLPIILKNYTAP